MELTVEQVGRDRGSGTLAAIDGHAAPPGPCPQCLHPHQTFDAVQAAGVSRLQHIPPYAACAVSAIAIDKAQPHLLAQRLVIQAATAPRPGQPRIEPAARHTERLAHHQHRPGPSVLRHEAVLHIDSLAK